MSFVVLFALSARKFQRDADKRPIADAIFHAKKRITSLIARTNQTKRSKSLMGRIISLCLFDMSSLYVCRNRDIIRFYLISFANLRLHFEY